jgi:hypothetical protein
MGLLPFGRTSLGCFIFSVEPNSRNIAVERIGRGFRHPGGAGTSLSRACANATSSGKGSLTKYRGRTPLRRRDNSYQRLQSVERNVCDTSGWAADATGQSPLEWTHEDFNEATPRRITFWVRLHNWRGSLRRLWHSDLDRLTKVRVLFEPRKCAVVHLNNCNAKWSSMRHHRSSVNAGKQDTCW